jgi:hypothetical protein
MNPDRTAFRYGLKDVFNENNNFLEVKSVKIQITCSRMSLAAPLTVDFVPVNHDLREAVLLLPVSLRSVLSGLNISFNTVAAGKKIEEKKFGIKVKKIKEVEDQFKGKQEKGQSSGVVRLLYERQDCILFRIGCIPALVEVQVKLLFSIQPSDPIALNTYRFSITTVYECFVGKDTNPEIRAHSTTDKSLALINEQLASQTIIESLELKATSSCGVIGLQAASSTHHIKKIEQSIDNHNNPFCRYTVHDSKNKASDGRFEFDYTLPEIPNTGDHSNCIVINKEVNRNKVLHSVVWKHRMPVALLYPAGQQNLAK